MIPITGCAAYICGLASQCAWIEDMDQAIGLFMRSIPFNCYCFLSVLMVLGLVTGIIPDFGGMRRAERRAMETGKVVRDGAVPMMGKELTELESTASSSSRTNLFLNFLLPVLIVVVTNATAFCVTGRPKVLESFMLACAVLAVTLWFQRVDTPSGIMQTSYAGMNGVMPAAMFMISAFISFATGTAWGTYAIMIPIAHLWPVNSVERRSTPSSWFLCGGRGWRSVWRSVFAALGYDGAVLPRECL